MNQNNNTVINKKRGRKAKTIEPINNTIAIENNSDSEESKSFEVEQKKRGRKPKNKEETHVNNIKEHKKRGRKPKNKDDESTLEKHPKKRGRKPKEKSYGVINNTINEIDNDNIIIHLPIKSDHIKNSIKENELLTYDPIIKDPVGYEENLGGLPVDNFQFISQKNNPNKEGELIGEGPKPNTSYCCYPFDEKQKDIFEILENNSESSSSDNPENNGSFSIINDEFNIQHTKNWFNDHDQNFIKNNTGIDKIMNFIKNQREEDFDNLDIKQNKNTVEKCLIQFDECNKTNTWPSSTSIYCWWCCHPFNGSPCPLPCEYKNNTFHVLGVFCSPECAAAYNFDDNNSGNEIWERYALLNYLYRKVYNDKNIKIKLAPPRQTLKIFGGNLSIKEFRHHNTNQDMNYRIIMPPMTSIIPVQEISTIDRGYSSKNEKKYITIEKDKISNNNSTSLRLKRNKPFSNNSNTLDKCMLISNNDCDESVSMNSMDF